MSKRAEAKRQQARQEKNFKEVLEKQFKNVQQQALAMGAFAMCSAILKKADEPDVSDADRLVNIREFCKVIIKEYNDDDDDKQDKEKEEAPTESVEEPQHEV